jgi:hypothetical protein
MSNLEKKVPKSFDRFKPHLNRTLALRAFNNCETEINEHFWSFKVISEYSRFIAEAEKRKDPNKTTAEVFKASGPDARRIPPTVFKWLDAREELENWLRLSALVSATSYLELYVGQVIRSALMSDPLCRFAASKVLDGVILLKKGKELPYSFEIEDVTKGEWNSRLAAFQRIFGPGAAVMTPDISALEKVRKIRNEFAHGFGRALTVPSPSASKIEPAQRLTHQAFVKHIAVLSKTAAMIDKFLLANFIGSFEIVHYYHEWKSKRRDARDKGYDPIRALQRSFNRDLACVVSGEFCEELIAYYDAL